MQSSIRIGIHQKTGTGSNAVLEAFIVDTSGGDVAFGAPFARNTNDTLTTTTTDVSIGTTNSSPLNARFDNIDIDTGALPGPSASVNGPMMAQVAATTRPLVAQAKPAQNVTQAWGNAAPAPLAQTSVQTRTITYAYDGLQRLTGADASVGADYTYSYDLAGNRTDGGRTYDAANQVANAGYSYDNAGNLTSDGTTSYTYDALNRVKDYTVGGQTRANSYNGDGTLVAQVLGSTTTRYTQDLASPLSQVLNSGGANYVYGAERLFASTSGVKTWYGSDALGSVRQTLSNTGVVQGVVNYDPWGAVQSSGVATFGFTGEVQDGNNLYLRARWYSVSAGRFTAQRWRTDESSDTTPYSHHVYAYALGNPVSLTDPTGKYAVDPDGNSRCSRGYIWDSRSKTCRAKNPNLGTWLQDGWTANEVAQRRAEYICGPEPSSDWGGARPHCNPRTKQWEPILTGTIVLPGPGVAGKLGGALKGLGDKAIGLCLLGLGTLADTWLKTQDQVDTQTQDNTQDPEIFYRAMSTEEYQLTMLAGKLLPKRQDGKGEKFVTPQLWYAIDKIRRNPVDYQVVVKFITRAGTTSALKAFGAASRGQPPVWFKRLSKNYSTAS